MNPNIDVKYVATSGIWKYANISIDSSEISNISWANYNNLNIIFFNYKMKKYKKFIWRIVKNMLDPAIKKNYWKNSRIHLFFLL